MGFGKFLGTLPKAVILSFIYLIIANLTFAGFKKFFEIVSAATSGLPSSVKDIIHVFLPFKPMDFDYKFTNALLLTLILALMTIIYQQARAAAAAAGEKCPFSGKQPGKETKTD